MKQPKKTRKRRSELKGGAIRSVREVGFILGITPQEVSRVEIRAKKKLRALLQPVWDDFCEAQ